MFLHFLKALKEDGIEDEDALIRATDSKLRSLGLPDMLIANLRNALSNLYAER